MFDMRHGWNRASRSYQALRPPDTNLIDYGPWSPPEAELRLLGDLRGLRVLDLGCGGGQTTLAFAKQGAIAAGIDLSDEQIAFARRLARTEESDVLFQQGDAADLSTFADGAWDLLFSAYVLPYVEEIERCLAACARILAPHGRLVFSLDHPVRSCFHDDEELDVTLFPVRSYFDTRPLTWQFDGDRSNAPIPMRSFHRTVAQWCDLLAGAGFRLARIVEPLPPVEVLDEVWPAGDPRESLRNLPQAIIFVAERTAPSPRSGERSREG